MKRKRIILQFLSVAFLLCACQSAPEQEAVISKNDGAFDIGIIQSATETTMQSLNEETDETVTPTSPRETVQYQIEFASTDNSTTFIFDINQEITQTSMPVVQVSPHYLTAADAERIAKVLFGEQTFYEVEPLGQEVFSASEIQDAINRLLNYEGDAGIGDEFFQVAKDNFIKEYTLKLETAPTENPHSVCQWNFRKSSYYYMSAEEFASVDTSQDNDQIQARANCDGIPYLYEVSTRNKSDFKLNNIYARIDDGISPLEADIYYYQSLLCTTEKPDENDLNAVKEKAEDILTQMDLGQWSVDECYVENLEQGNGVAYAIVVKAVPAFEQVPAVRRPQLESLKSTESYASNYYLTDVQFTFSPDGKLLNFEMYSPVDTTSVINSNVETLSFSELFQLAQTRFQLSDYYEYDYYSLIGNMGEELHCNVTISEFEYGLTRVKVPNTDESYYYVPAIFFYGTIQYEGETTGEVFDVENGLDSHFPLLILNAIDGSVINATNG